MAWVQGIDVSHWQRPTRPAWARFAWVKASQGRSMRDKAMASHHRHLEGLARGPYHYYDWSGSPAANAANFLAATAGRTWELPHVLDAEHGTAGSKAATAAALLDFLRRVETGTGRVPVVYTYASWWNANVAPDPTFKRYPLWIARYPTAYRDGNPPPTSASTGAAAPWPHWSVWQYSTAGNLDRNVTTATALAALTGRPTPIARPTEDPLMALTDNEQHELLAGVRELRSTAARKAFAVRAASDARVWIVTPTGRWWCKTRVALDLLLFTGQISAVGSDGPALVDDDWLAAIPETNAPAGADIA